MNGLIRPAMKLLIKHMLNKSSVNYMKRVQKLDEPEESI